VGTILSSGYVNDIEHNSRQGAFIDNDDALEGMLAILQVFLVMMAAFLV
jgi:hypothetical protein